MSEKEVLALVVTKILNKTDTEISDQIYEKVGDDIVLKENAGEIILNLYSEKAKAQKQELTAKFDQGFQKNDKETTSEIKERLEEDYGFKTDKTIRKEIYDEFKEFQKAKAKPSPLKDDEIKAHPVFIEREKQLKKEAEQIKAELEEKITSTLTAYQKKENAQKFKSFIKDKAIEMGIILPESVALQERQMKAFLSDFDEYDYDYTDPNDPIISKDGARLEDKLGNLIKAEDFAVNSIKGFFPIKVQDGKGSAGNDPKGGSTTFYSFKDHSDYMKQFDNAATLQEKQKIGIAWDSSPVNPDRKV